VQRETQNGARREDHEELGQLLEEAARFLERWDIRSANEALKKAGDRASAMRGGIGPSELPAHEALLTDLIRTVQNHVDRPGRTGPLVELPGKLEEVRRGFDHEARKDAGEITADEAGSLPGWDRSAGIGLPRPKAS
jgi:hypothetical protein